MLDKFVKESLYIFDKNKYKVYNGTIPNWVEICHGLIVEVENEYIGNIKVEGEEHVVFPYSCNKIEVDVKSAETENVYKNDTINDVIGTIQIEPSLKGSKPKEFEGKIFFGIDKDNHWTDAGFSLLDNLEDKPINNHSKELIFNKNKEYYFDVNLVDKKDIKDWMYCCNESLVDVTDVNKGFVLDLWGDEYHIVFRKWCREEDN